MISYIRAFTIGLTGAAPFSVYLHLECANVDGMSAAEFSLSSNFFNAGFTPLAGALNAGDSVNLLLAVGGCPGAGTVLGQWTFLDFTGLGGNACLVNSPGGVNGTVDCDVVNPQVNANAVTGYTTDGSSPCTTDTCTTVSVEAQSWGGVKSLYR